MADARIEQGEESRKMMDNQDRVRPPSRGGPVMAMTYTIFSEKNNTLVREERLPEV